MYETILIYFLLLVVVVKLFFQPKIKINRNKIVFCIAYDKLNTEGYLESVVRTYIINLK
jgi:hypothetical protein